MIIINKKVFQTIAIIFAYAGLFEHTSATEHSNDKGKDLVGYIVPENNIKEGNDAIDEHDPVSNKHAPDKPHLMDPGKG